MMERERERERAEPRHGFCVRCDIPPKLMEEEHLSLFSSIYVVESSAYDTLLMMGEKSPMLLTLP